ASLFGQRDGVGDVMLAGAFADSLARKGLDGVRMLFQHDPAEPVGTWLELRENHRGLYVMGRLDCNVQRGRELLSLLESGGLDGLSIGFKTVTAARDKTTATRRLIQVDLWEISLVTFPMLAGARATATRNAAEQLFAARAAPVPRPQREAIPSLASLFRDGARQFQQGVN
ncbi:MAG: HK97 family phage prohead protease, partial [Methylocella sp.]